MVAVLRGATSPALMSQTNVAPHIEALEPESWGVSWGVTVCEHPQALDMQGNTGKELELARGIEPPTG